MVELKKLSPSRASDFQNCPLLFRYRTIDRLPEPPSIDALRGTLIHETLEKIFDLASADRTQESANEIWHSIFDNLNAEESSILVDLLESKNEFIESSIRLLSTYFSVENPQLLEPSGREIHIEHEGQEGLHLHGIIDRLDSTNDGKIRIVDYKTGKSPRSGYEQKALFQLKFYSLILWKSTGVVPSMLRIIYLGDGTIIEHVPSVQDLEIAEKKIIQIWRTIEECIARKEFPPKKSALCGWCNHQKYCPEFGGEILPFPSSQE